LQINSLLLLIAGAPLPVTVDTVSTTNRKDPTKWNEPESEKDYNGKATNLHEVVNRFKYYGEVALYYSSAGFFTVIIIYHELLKSTNNDSNSTDLVSKEIFNADKLMLENDKKQDSSSGLIRVVKLNNTYTIDLNGTYPENMESEFKDNKCVL